MTSPFSFINHKGALVTAAIGAIACAGLLCPIWFVALPCAVVTLCAFTNLGITLGLFLEGRSANPHQNLEVAQDGFRISDRYGNIVEDEVYSPLTMTDDWNICLPIGDSKIELLPQDECFGNLDDLDYFNQKLRGAMALPASYLAAEPTMETNVTISGSLIVNEPSSITTDPNEEDGNPLDDQFPLPARRKK